MDFEKLTKDIFAPIQHIKTPKTDKETIELMNMIIREQQSLIIAYKSKINSMLYDMNNVAYSLKLYDDKYSDEIEMGDCLESRLDIWAEMIVKKTV